MAFLRRLYRDFTGGTNLRDSPLSVAPEDVIQAENMYPVEGGFHQGRGGQTEYNETQIDANPIRSLFRFYKQDGTGILIATSGTKVYEGDDGAGTLSEIDSGYTADRKFDFVTWSTKDKVYWTNGAEALKSYDGTTVAAVGGSPPVVKRITLYQNRLFGLQDNSIPFTDLNVDNSWPAANALAIGDKLGGIGQFLKAYSTDQIEILVAGKNTGLWRFQGSPILGASLEQYSDVPCIAGWTAVVTPYGIPFLGPDGIYLTNGFSVERVSGKIDPVFTSYFRTAVGGWHTKKRQYYFSFDPAAAANDQLWVGTVLQQGNKKKVAWNKWTGFKAESFVSCDGGSDVGQFFYGRSDEGKVRRADIGSQDVGVDYKCEFQTRWDDFGEPELNKQLRFFTPSFDASKPVTYEVGYQFGAVESSGPVEAGSKEAITWGPGTVDWDGGGVTWVAGPSVINRRTSELSMLSGRHLSMVFKNTGDGGNFRFFSLLLTARLKHQRHQDLFAIGGA